MSAIEIVNLQLQYHNAEVTEQRVVRPAKVTLRITITDDHGTYVGDAQHGVDRNDLELLAGPLAAIFREPIGDGTQVSIGPAIAGMATRAAEDNDELTRSLLSMLPKIQDVRSAYLAQ